MASPRCYSTRVRRSRRSVAGGRRAASAGQGEADAVASPQSFRVCFAPPSILRKRRCVDLSPVPQWPVSPLQAAMASRLPDGTLRPAPLAVPDLQVAILCRGRAGVICLLRPLQPLRQLQPSADLPQPCLRGLVGRALPPTALPGLPVCPVPLSLRHLPAAPPNRAASFGASEKGERRAAFLSAAIPEAAGPGRTA